MGKPIAPRPDFKYVGLDLTLIGYIEISIMCIYKIMRGIKMIQMYQNDMNILSMIQVIKPLRLRLSLR